MRGTPAPKPSTAKPLGGCTRLDCDWQGGWDCAARLCVPVLPLLGWGRGAVQGVRC